MRENLGLNASYFSWGKSFLQVLLPSCFLLFSFFFFPFSFSWERFLSLDPLQPTETRQIFHCSSVTTAGLKLWSNHALEIRRVFLKALPWSTWFLQHHRRHFPLVPSISSVQPLGSCPEDPVIAQSVCDNLHDLLCHTVSKQQFCRHGWCTEGRFLKRCKYWWHQLRNSRVASTGWLRRFPHSTHRRASGEDVKELLQVREISWLVLQGEFLEPLVALGRVSALAWTARGHEERRKTSGCYIKSTSVRSLEW